MSQVTTTNGGKLDGFYGLLGAVLPQYLDYRYGRDPNTLQQNMVTGYGYSPTGDGSADSARAQALYGTGPIGALPVGTVILLALGAFLLYKAA